MSGVFPNRSMPPGHYDLDDCGGVHERPNILSGDERRAVQEAYDQARKVGDKPRPRRKAKVKPAR